MPVSPNLLERLVLLRLNRGPGPVLDLVGGGAARAVGVALELDLFAAVEAGRETPAAIADAVDADERGVAVLLDFLEPLGYVRESDGRYELAAMTEAWLRPDGKTDVGAWLRLWDELIFPFWDEHLATAVREGAPPMTVYEWFDEDPERWHLAHEGFRASARLLLDAVVDDVDLVAADRLLDVGGGHGLYAVGLCEANPDLRATVFDAEPAREVCAETVAESGVGGRVDFQAGDYLADDLGAGYDAALLFNVLHAHPSGEARDLLARVRDALAPGGRLYVLDQFAGSGRTSLARTALGFIGLNYLVTLGVGAHEESEVRAWLADAGFAVERRERYRTAPGVSLLVASAN